VSDIASEAAEGAIDDSEKVGAPQSEIEDLEARVDELEARLGE